MTQFDLLKAGYRQLIERGEMTAEEVAAKIRVLDFLASCSKDDIYEIVDSAILSDIIKGYTQKACNAAGFERRTNRECVGCFRFQCSIRCPQKTW